MLKGVQIEWHNKARKQLKKLNNPQAVRRILAAIEEIAAGGPCDVKTLTDQSYSHRLRVGDFRVFMTIDSIIEISWIEEVKKRDERTY
jgi:mRNA-degrading endonuclease RelE of RelBE toxin-antitoxin system